MSTQTNDPIEQELSPIVKVTDKNGQLQLTIREGVSGWEAIGALKLAITLIENTYTTSSPERDAKG